MRNPFITKEALEKLYVEEERPMWECAEILGVATGTVFNYLKKYGIKSRPAFTEKTRRKMSEAQKKRPHRRGFHLSEEVKRKISETQKGRVYKPSKYGGHTKNRKDGYIYVYLPEHPYSSKEGYVMEHILVMEAHLGHYITRDYVVHHKNHIRNDNRIENLELMSFKEHAGLHMKERWLKRKENIA